MDRTASVKILDFGSLKAFVSVNFDGMEIRGFKVIDQGDGKPWVAMPSREIVKEGRKEFYNIVRFNDKDKRVEFSDWVLRCYREEEASARG